MISFQRMQLWNTSSIITDDDDYYDCSPNGTFHST
jgi:hypothetical protein